MIVNHTIKTREQYNQLYLDFTNRCNLLPEAKHFFITQLLMDKKIPEKVIGLILMYIQNRKAYFGFSRCVPWDKFDLVTGLELAVRRSEQRCGLYLDNSIRRPFRRFISNIKQVDPKYQELFSIVTVEDFDEYVNTDPDIVDLLKNIKFKDHYVGEIGHIRRTISSFRILYPKSELPNLFKHLKNLH